MRRILLLLAAAAAADSAEVYSQWAHSSVIYFNTTPDGANVPRNVMDFPVAIRLHGANFNFSESYGRGRDLRFAKPNGTHLHYEIEMWDSAHTEAAVWVKLDTVRGNASNQSITMYWGKPGAADSSNGPAVFDSSDFAEVWHLGGAAARDRKSSVAGGQNAVPQNYDGDESKTGVMGKCDSLDADSAGADYLDIGDGYDKFTSGFTFSVWINPVSVQVHSHILELGNGPGLDNILVQRRTTTNDMDFIIYNGGTTTWNSRARAKSVLSLNEWQQFTVTLDGKIARIYRDGSLMIEDTLDLGIQGVRRAFNFLGKSSWAGNGYFQGKIDEPWLSKKAHDANWVKLAYASQKLPQSLYSFQQASPGCQEAFDAPTALSVAEGSVFILAGVADCATDFYWSLVSGPGPLILDPQEKTLQVPAPRTSKQFTLVYSFNADFPSGSKSKQVTVTILDAIPDPVFTLPDTLPWNGTDSLVIKPDVTNLAALRASGDSLLNCAWTMSGVASDTSWRDETLVLKAPASPGMIHLQLCLDNNGTPACRPMEVKVDPATVSALPAGAGSRPPAIRAYRDALGRNLAARRALRGFYRP